MAQYRVIASGILGGIERKIGDMVELTAEQYKAAMSAGIVEDGGRGEMLRELSGGNIMADGKAVKHSGDVVARRELIDQILTIQKLDKTSTQPASPFKRPIIAYAEKQTGYRNAVNASGQTASTYEDDWMVVQDEGTDAQFLFGNYVGNNVGANPITIKAGFKYGTAYYPLHFRGSREITIEPGGLILTDPIAVRFTKANTIKVHTHVKVETSGMTWPSGSWSGLCATGSTDYTLADLPGSAVSNLGLYGPLACVGTVATSDKPMPNVLLIGASSLAGTSDGTSGRGFGKAALANKLPFVRLASAGESASSFTALTGYTRRAITGIGDVAIVDYGSNEVEAGKTLEQVKAELTALAMDLHLRNIRVIMCTIRPRVSSTDSFATVANQSFTDTAKYGPGSVQSAVNDWIRTNPFPMSGYFETCGSVTDPATGLWLGGGVTEGIHATTVGVDIMKTAVDIDALYDATISNPYAPAFTPPVNPPTPTVPTAPTGLSATAGDKLVGLSWSSVSGATSYNVYRGGTKVNGSAVTSTTYSDTGLTNGTSQSYQVTAINAAGESSKSSTVTATPTAPATAPSAPSGLSATAGNASVSLSFTAVSGATGYNVYQGSTKITSSPITITTHNVTGLTNGTAYTFQVSAVNAVGESTKSSSATATPTATDVVYSDDFNRAEIGSDWTAAGVGTWAIDSNKLITNGGNGLAMLEQEFPGYSDFDISLDLAVGSSKSCGILFHYLDDTNFMYYRIDGDGAQVRLYRFETSSNQLTNATGLTYAEGDSLTIRLKKVGRDTEMYFNGTLVKSYTIAEDVQTKFGASVNHGVYATNGASNNTKFDNFVLKGTT